MDSPFVTTEWLAAHLNDPQVVILDGSWWLPTANRKPREEYLAGHIPGAVFFDIDGVADKTTGLPHMLLSPDEFARQVGALGVGDRMTIVVYDEAGLFSAPRVWWEFTIMGAPDVRILQGGGPKWRAEGRPLESGDTKREPASFTARFHPDLVAGLDQVRAAVSSQAAIVDARPYGRFIGRDPEPRPGVKGGRMPGAMNLPVTDIVVDGLMKAPAELRVAFKAAGVDLSKPMITSCGSGIMASTLFLAAKLAGASNVAVYDGSWAEWGSRDDTPIATGP